MRILAHAIAGTALGSVLFVTPLRAQESLEYHVKAAFLLNFARFIEWPESAFVDARSPINICVFGSNPFGEALEQTVQGEMAGQRTLAVREIDAPAEAARCHLVFVPASMEARAAAMLRRTDSPAVTVGESRRFLDLGGAVNMVLQGGRVQFNVNLEPVEQRGIRISARMLQLASHVRRAVPP